MQSAVRIRREALETVMRHAEQDSRLECCGLLAGGDGAITNAFAATNAAADAAKNYEIAPEQLFQLMREIRAAGLALMGIYHSHPNGVNVPSPRDIDRAYYPDVAYFIVSPRAPAPVRAFSIRAGRVKELKIIAE
ncbi:MAG: M67 family metallopeptidase [Candidatus Acidiferrales bacterium]